MTLTVEPGYRWQPDDANQPHGGAIGGALDASIHRLAALRLISTLYHAPGVATPEVPVAPALTGVEAGVAAVVLVDLLDDWIPTIDLHALAGFAPALASGSEGLLGATYVGMGAGIGLDYRLADPFCVGLGVRYTVSQRPLDLSGDRATGRGALDLFLRLSLRRTLF